MTHRTQRILIIEHEPENVFPWVVRFLDGQTWRVATRASSFENAQALGFRMSRLEAAIISF
ncbi:hypothetical protein LCGC14_1633560 [marine sediment metagenome]|uniref:Uncharacterized protein n=1 Tax=marine sediment metagenome TaxID=412755 RepID=A0A0F9I1X3_9ZZZZ